MNDLTPPAGFRLARTVLAAVGWIVPAARRRTWRAEWEAEVWMRLAAHRDRRGAPAGAWELAGALPHALWLRRDQWRLDMIAQDLKYAWRTTRSRPVFSAIVIGTLALGIGATTTMFTVVNSVLIQPLAFPHAEQLVHINGAFEKTDRAAISPPDFVDYRAANTVFSAMAAMRLGGSVALSSPTGDPERLVASQASAGFFETLRVPPLLGRTFRPNEEQPGAAPVALLSFGLWRRRFAGDPQVVGTTVVLDGVATQIIGVLPEVVDRGVRANQFGALPATDIWGPLTLYGPGMVRRYHSLEAVGRLRADVSLSQAQSTMDLIARRLAATYPENDSWHLRLRPYRDVVVGDAGPALLLLMAAVTLVLCIACGNVASLLLARASARQNEIAVRTALGASGTRLVRLLLTESALYGVGGALLGIALAMVAIRLARGAGAGIVPRLSEITVDLPVMLFAVVLAFATSILFGLAPAIQALRGNLASGGALTVRGASAGRRTASTRDVLVGLQVALSLVLLTGAGLLIRSLSRLQHVDAGVTTDHLLTARIGLTGPRYDDSVAVRHFWDDLPARLASVPGVVDVAAANTLPLTGASDTYYWIDGETPKSSADRRNAVINAVGTNYFRTMHIPLLAGRPIGATDRTGSPVSFVISRSLAHTLFADSAVGRRIVVDLGTPTTGTIVGVAGDVLSFGLDSKPGGVIYYSPQQFLLGAGRINVVVRTSVPPERLAPAIRAAAAQVDRSLPVSNIRTMEEVIAGTTTSQRFASGLLLAFAGCAVLLTLTGLYGVLAFVVSQRRREIGIRLALGASQRAIFRMVLQRGMAVVVAGLALGLLASLASGRLVASQLFDAHGADPLVLGGAALLLLAAGAVAAALPARRAMRVSPQTALRSD